MKPPEIRFRTGAVAYWNVHAIHLVAVDASGTEYELARRSNKFLARVRSADVEGLEVSNGKVLYKALPRAGQWMKTWSHPNNEESGVDADLDLYGRVARKLAGVYSGAANADDQAQGLRITKIEVDDEVSNSLFTFTPERKWKEKFLLFLPGEVPRSLVGLPAADFELANLKGDVFRLSSFRGKVVVLDFWATWCQPCRKGLAAINKLRVEFPAVQFLSVDDEEPDVLGRFMHEHGFGFEVLRDADLRIHSLFGVRAIPAVYLIDRNGIVRKIEIGPNGEGALRRAIQSALKFS